MSRFRARSQNLQTLPIAVVVLVADSNRLESLERLVPDVLEALKTLKPKTLLRMVPELTPTLRITGRRGRLLCDACASCPSPSGQRDRPVGFGWQALSYAVP